MRVTGLALGDLGTNCWVAGDDAGGPVVVIDPADAPAAVMTAVGTREVAAIVLTHGHFDHVGAVGALKERTGAPVCVHRLDAEAVVSPATNGGAMFGYEVSAPEPDRVLDDGDEVTFGDSLLRVVHTPGHTPGGICLFSAEDEGHLFCGDTVFAGSVGRTDLPEGDGRALRRSIEERVATLPDETVLHPGHGAETTVGRERRMNPFFPRS